MKPLLLGHRGARASRHVPENSLGSFELCLQHGCDGFEFDVRRSADGEAVICHDASAGGKSIEKTSARNLGLPTLEEVFRQFSSHAFLDIELKVTGLEQRTIAALHQYPPHRGYVVSSFLPEVLSAINVLDATIPLGFLCESREQLRQWFQSPAVWIIPQVKLVDRELVDEARASGKKTMVWTVNDAEKMRQLSGWGVDAIISDDTALAAQVASAP
jgi:glycerophosphoryl diester phosphodiesterase